MDRTPNSDLDRVEDLAARALMAGRLAALGLAALKVDSSRWTAEVRRHEETLTSDQLFSESALLALDDLETKLEDIVAEERFEVPVFGCDEADFDIGPTYELTERGQEAAVVKSDLAVAIGTARYVLALLDAEKFVGRTRGIAA